MTAAQRLNVEEGKDFVALEELKGRDIACSTDGDMLARRPSQLGTRGNWAIWGSRARHRRGRPTLDDLAEDTRSRRHGGSSVRVVSK